MKGCHSFLATSFDSFKESFRSGTVSKYALVYMAQPLSSRAPSFCLACFGTDNKFNTELVLKYIYTECCKRGITVISFGADGDTRELCGMKRSSALFSQPCNSLGMQYPFPGAHQLPICQTWKAWFAVHNHTMISYVQDVVHIAVRMKSRLIKPSIILPLGNYAAGVHHLSMVQGSFGKDLHGLCERDIDKQNYEAILRITS